MEVNGEEERGSRREDYCSLLNSPCSACNNIVQLILKCLGLDETSSASSSPSPSPSSSSLVEEDLTTDEAGEERGVMATIRGVLRRRPRPSVSPGQPGQIN